MSSSKKWKIYDDSESKNVQPKSPSPLLREPTPIRLIPKPKQKIVSPPSFRTLIKLPKITRNKVPANPEKHKRKYPGESAFIAFRDNFRIENGVD